MLNTIRSVAGEASGAIVNRFTASRPSIADRMAAGKDLRNKIPRNSLGTFEPQPERPNPVAILQMQATTRLRDLVPVRHARMLKSPFAYLRGSAAVMAADLAGSPTTGLQVQACGDMHVSNFGVFASAERRLVFAINDFDETLPAAWEWDIKRLAASAVVAARHLNGVKSDQEAAVRAAVSSYRSHMQTYAQMGYMETWYATIDERDILAVLSPQVRKRAKRVFKKARGRNHLQVLDKMTQLIDDKHRIVEERPLIVRTETSTSGRPIREALGMLLEAYLESLGPDRQELLSRYQVIDAARKVVGVGSVGTRCWVILLRGSNENDPLFLQVKEAQQSVLAPYFKQNGFRNEGQRVVAGQRMIQGSPDIFLGWGDYEGKHFYVRQLRDMKGGAEIEPGDTPVSALVEYCGLCGWALALAHAKSGDAAMLAGYVGTSDRLDLAITNFALAYADQTERDFETLTKAARNGEIEVADDD